MRAAKMSGWEALALFRDSSWKMWPLRGRMDVMDLFFVPVPVPVPVPEKIGHTEESGTGAGTGLRPGHGASFNQLIPLSTIFYRS